MFVSFVVCESTAPVGCSRIALHSVARKAVTGQHGRTRVVVPGRRQADLADAG